MKEDWPPHDDAVALYEEYTSVSGGVYLTGEDSNLVFELSDTLVEVNESISNNFTKKRGKFNDYGKLKAPFAGGSGQPQGTITKASFGDSKCNGTKKANIKKD